MAVTAAAGGGGGLTCRRPPTPDCHCAVRPSELAGRANLVQ